jgi:hypothetical protein
MSEKVKVLIVALIISSGFSGCGSENGGEEECGGFGTLVEGECSCNAGYVQDPDDPTNCIEETVEDCSGHGQLVGGECQCDQGYMQDPNDVTKCMEEVEQCNGHGQLVGGECQCDQGYAQDPNDSQACLARGTATDVQLGLHGNQVKILLATMEVVGMEATEWDLYMDHDAPADDGPNMKLGPGVTAQSLGSSEDYHAIDEAPVDDYLADDAGSEVYVIGDTWRAGGAGATGVIMSENVYVVKLADGTYAKIEVLSAQSGEIHVLCYRQADGSRFIGTTAP